MKYKWLLFDADGTLFDFEQAEAQALQRTFAHFGLTFRKEEARVYHRVNARIWAEFERGEITQANLRTERFARLFEALGLVVEAAAFSRSYLQNLGEGHFLIDGAQELLECLAGRAELLLITNGLKEVQRSRLERSTILPFFAEVIISEEVGAAKPDSRIFEAAFRKMGQPAKGEALIIGDSLTSDIRGGNRFGIDTCWFNPQGKTRDQDVDIQYEIRRLEDLLPVLDLRP